MFIDRIHNYEWSWALNQQCTLDMYSYYYCVLHCDLNIIDVWYLGAQVKDWSCLL